ncbi:hypothetical protein [Burkholderia guangdongensis]|uniref:hypothetical protein n=1 Tax=Burkholderia guangdongensis TaxID=1792500 RepID=UPI0015CEBE70|nr:hypothetical protein [Burkholderia guangdongensis]
MNREPLTFKLKYLQRAKWLALVPISALLAGCPPMIVPNIETEKYDKVYSIPADPRPWLTLENDGINLYLYQECGSHEDWCYRQQLVALKSGTPPDWKNLLEAREVSWRVQGANLPMRRPLSAYVPGTKYRLMGSFDDYPEIVLSNPKNLVDNNNINGPALDNRYTKIEDFNDLAHPVNIDVQLVIYDDDHQWIFANQPKFNSDRKNPPTDLFIPSKLFQFEASDDARLNQPMALYYSGPNMIPHGYRVVSGNAVKWWTDKYNIKHYANQIALADVMFPSVPLKLDTLTVDSKTVPTRPTLLCHYSHTQFNLGWMDAAQHGPPSEADRKGCEPYHGQAEVK